MIFLARRLLFNSALAAGMFLLPLAGAPERLSHPSPWLGFIFAGLILVLQPPIDPKEMTSATAEDKRSSLGIYIGMIVPQVAAVIDFGYRSVLHPAPWGALFVTALVIAGAGLTFRLWSIHTLGRFFTSTVVVQQDQVVVNTGPYRLLRHPSYTGALVGAVGMAMLFASVVGFVLVVALAFPAYLYRMHVEERELAEKLGPPYQTYMSKTKKLVPFIY